MLSWFRKHRDAPEKALVEALGEFELPSFEPAVMEILSAVRDPELDVSEVAARVLTDPGLNVRVLRVVNSAAFGSRVPVTSIEKAVSLIGRSRLESMVLAVAVRDTLDGIGDIPLDLNRYWLASARRATVARAFAAQWHPENQSECFTAGMLQDMAVPLLFASRALDYGPIYEAWCADPSIRLVDLEREALGFDHAAIGGLLAKKWDLPDLLVDAIAGHHEDGADANESGESCPSAVRLASWLRDSDEIEDLDAFCDDALPGRESERDCDRAKIAHALDEAMVLAQELRAGA